MFFFLFPFKSFSSSSLVFFVFFVVQCLSFTVFG